MATIRNFEDLEAWQTGRALTCAVYRISRGGAFAGDLALRDQIRRAAVSVTSNIAEGFERNSIRAFLHFLSMAKGSAGEVRSQLYVALDEGYISRACFDQVYGLATLTLQKVGGLMQYLHKHKRQKAEPKPHEQTPTRNPQHVTRNPQHVTRNRP